MPAARMTPKRARGGMGSISQYKKHEPDGCSPPPLQFDRIGKKLRQMKSATLRTEPHGRRPQVEAMEGGTPRQNNAFGPSAVENVEDRDGALVLRAGAPRSLGYQGDVAFKKLPRPRTL